MKTKRIIVFLAFAFWLAGNINAQVNLRLTPTVRPTQGGSNRMGNLQFDYTIGEASQTTLCAGNIVLTGGFQQVEMPKIINPVPAQNICSDTTNTIVFRNVVSEWASHIEWSLDSNFGSSHYINRGDSIVVNINSGTVDTIWLRGSLGTNGIKSLATPTKISVLPNIHAANKITVANELCEAMDSIHLSGVNISGTYAYQWQNSLNGIAFSNILDQTDTGLTISNPVIKTWIRRILHETGHCEKASNYLKFE